MSHHRYSADYVAVVRPPDAREFLTTVGLPDDHVLFAAGEEKAEQVGARLLLPIGAGDPESEDVYVVDCATGNVAYLNRIDMTVSHVSASPRQFDDCLRIFEAEVTAIADDPEDIAERLRQQIEAADPTALAEDPGFWVDVLFDVANGDYSEDDD